MTVILPVHRAASAGLEYYVFEPDSTGVWAPMKGKWGAKDKGFYGDLEYIDPDPDYKEAGKIVIHCSDNDILDVPLRPGAPLRMNSPILVIGRTSRKSYSFRIANLVIA